MQHDSKACGASLRVSPSLTGALFPLVTSVGSLGQKIAATHRWSWARKRGIQRELWGDWRKKGHLPPPGCRKVWGSGIALCEASFIWDYGLCSHPFVLKSWQKAMGFYC